MTLAIFEIIVSVIVFDVLVAWILKVFKEKAPANRAEEDGKYNEIFLKIENQFEAIANKLLVKNSEYIQESSKRGVANLLNPLMQEMKDYESRIEKMVHTESLDRESMKQMILEANNLQKNFSDDVKKFAVSVRGNIHSMGRLGENCLQGIIDASGLTEGHDYLKQKALLSSDGNCLKPDFVLTLPNGRAIAVDSKLSLDPFFLYMEETDEAKKKSHAMKLLENIEEHVSSLSKKKYQQITEFQMMDFVIMFVSSESVLSLSLSLKPQLLRESLRKGILIAGPSSMMATIKSLELLGRENRQAKNLQEIALVGKKLYERMSFFFDRLNSCQDHLAKASKALDTSINHLSVGEHSVVNEALKLKTLGISAEKEMVVPKILKKDGE